MYEIATSTQKCSKRRRWLPILLALISLCALALIASLTSACGTEATIGLEVVWNHDNLVDGLYEATLVPKGQPQPMIMEMAVLRIHRGKVVKEADLGPLYRTDSEGVPVSQCLTEPGRLQIYSHRRTINVAFSHPSEEGATETSGSSYVSIPIAPGLHPRNDGVSGMDIQFDVGNGFNGLTAETVIMVKTYEPTERTVLWGAIYWKGPEPVGTTMGMYLRLPDMIRQSRKYPTGTAYLVVARLLREREPRESELRRHEGESTSFGVIQEESSLEEPHEATFTLLPMGRPQPIVEVAVLRVHKGKSVELTSLKSFEDHSQNELGGAPVPGPLYTTTQRLTRPGRL